MNLKRLSIRRFGSVPRRTVALSPFAACFAACVLVVLTSCGTSGHAVSPAVLGTNGTAGPPSAVARLGGTAAFVQAADLPPGFREFADPQVAVGAAADQTLHSLLASILNGKTCSDGQTASSVPRVEKLVLSAPWYTLADINAAATSSTLFMSSNTVAHQAFDVLDGLTRCVAPGGGPGPTGPLAFPAGTVSRIVGFGDEAVLLRSGRSVIGVVAATIVVRRSAAVVIFGFDDGAGLTATSEMDIARRVLSRL